MESTNHKTRPCLPPSGKTWTTPSAISSLDLSGNGKASSLSQTWGHSFIHLRFNDCSQVQMFVSFYSCIHVSGPLIWMIHLLDSYLFFISSCIVKPSLPAVRASSSHSFKGLDLLVDCTVLDGRGQSLVLLDGQADTLLSRKRLAVLLVHLSDIDEHGLEVAGVGDWVT